MNSRSQRLVGYVSCQAAVGLSRYLSDCKKLSLFYDNISSQFLVLGAILFLLGKVQK
jgi:hypothetical protein